MFDKKGYTMFGERIKELRTSMNLNQVEFAKKLGITKQSVSNWENAYIQPSIDMLIRIARTFSVTSDYLLGLDGMDTVDITGLTEVQAAHIRAVISDLREK